MRATIQPKTTSVKPEVNFDFQFLQLVGQKSLRLEYTHVEVYEKLTPKKTSMFK